MSSLPRHTPASLLLPPSELSPSDLVICLPIPDQHASYHYHNDRFFRQVEYIREQAGDAIYIAGTQTPQPKGSFYFNNVFAMYEVEHWTNAAAHADYTTWVINTIKNVQDEKGLPTLTPAVRMIVKQCLQGWTPGTYCWLHHLFLDLEDVLSDRTVLARVGRNPHGTLVRGPHESCPDNEPGQEWDDAQDVSPESLDLCIDMDGKLRITQRLVDSESAESIIEDPALRMLFALALEPRRPQHGSMKRLLNRRCRGQGPNHDSQSAHNSGVDGHGMSGSRNIPNRLFTSAKAISPVNIDPMDLDEQDNAELDEVLAKLDAREASRNQAPQDDNGNIITSTILAGLQAPSASQQYGAEIASDAATVSTPGTVQQSGNDFSTNFLTTSGIHHQAELSGPVASHQFGSLPSYEGPVLPRTPLPRNPQASPRVPGSDSTIRLLSSSPVAPLPDQRASAPRLGAPGTLGMVPNLVTGPPAPNMLPRSPGKIPQSQKPPMTFGDIGTANKRKRADSQDADTVQDFGPRHTHSQPSQQQPRGLAGHYNSMMRDHQAAVPKDPWIVNRPNSFAMAPPPPPRNPGFAASAFSSGPTASQASVSWLGQQQTALSRTEEQIPTQHPQEQATSQPNAPAGFRFPLFQEYVPDVYVPYQYEQGSTGSGNAQQQRQQGPR